MSALHQELLERLAHGHDTALAHRKNERRTAAVVVVTLVMMVVELVVGTWTRSMALTADGWHMGTHAGALGLALIAYWYARSRARSAEFSFGTGKVYALSGFASALVLGVAALWMAVESVGRLLWPRLIDFREALPVAIVGLLVNVGCAALLSGHEHEHRDHDHDHGVHAHEHGGHAHDHGGHAHEGSAVEHDLNLRAAYLHVLADALTSVLAIGALLAGRYLELERLDPAMGILGGVLIGRWAVGLARTSARQLLDVTPSEQLKQQVARALEGIDDVRVADLHVWELGPERRGCLVTVVTGAPRATSFYRARVLEAVSFAHLTVEVHRCEAGCDGHPTEGSEVPQT